MPKSRARTHYDTLRVARDASPDDVRRAYRRLAQKYHPDRHPARDAAAAHMATINGAYDVLSDADSRARYDADLAQGDERTARDRARIASIDVPNVTRSSWFLVIVIAAFTTTTLAFVATYTVAPHRVSILPARIGGATSAPVDATPIAPVPPVQAWQPPPPSTAPANAQTDPVTRLVRDGVITPARTNSN